MDERGGEGGTREGKSGGREGRGEERGRGVGVRREEKKGEWKDGVREGEEKKRKGRTG